MRTPALLAAVSLAYLACSQPPPERANGTLPAPTPAGMTEASLPLDTFPKPLLTGRINPATDTAFVRLPEALTDGDGDYLLRHEPAEAVKRMIEAAAAVGVTLRVISATRNFERQAAIWGAKWTGARTLSNGVNLGTTDLSDSAKARMILLYSSMPGTSRHHWGTDVDLNDLNNDYFETGDGAREYAWLRDNAGRFGFFQPYTPKATGRSGYEEERWHWSYGPLSRKLLAAYARQITYDDIGGFPGAEVAPRVRAIEEYVYGISDPAMEE